MIRERLEAYYQKQSRYPDHILFFRDGVSESQFGMVREAELPQIRSACDNLRLQGTKITLVIVGKRHHTRFYPIDGSRTPDKKDRGSTTMKNLPAGSIVSSKIVAPRQFSYYLQSHDSPIGTARSAHYVVLENGSGYNADDLQRIVSSQSRTVLLSRHDRILTPLG
jgi:hypothetical protein